MACITAFPRAGQTPADVLTVDEFFHADMTGKVLSKVTFQGFQQNEVVACFKVMPRSQVTIIIHSVVVVCNNGDGGMGNNDIDYYYDDGLMSMRTKRR